MQLSETDLFNYFQLVNIPSPTHLPTHSMKRSTTHLRCRSEMLKSLTCTKWRSTSKTTTPWVISCGGRLDKTS